MLIDDGLSRNGSFVNGARMLGRHRLRGRRPPRASARPSVLYRDPGDGQSLLDRVAARERAHDAADADPAQGAGRALPPGQRRRPSRRRATNREIAEEVFLSVDAVKAQLRVLFERFGLEDLPQNQKRARLAASTLVGGLLSPRDF